ncbi:MAG: sulfotransferase [Pseudomarimonas sp.]
MDAIWWAGNCCCAAADVSGLVKPTVDTDALLREGALLHQQGQRLAAIECFKQALATRPQSAEGWYELGYLLKAEGKYEEALAAYQHALARGIRRPEEVHLNCGVIYADHLRRDDAAEDALNAALQIAPTYVPALLNLGNLREEQGRRDEALECYQRILTRTLAGVDPHQELYFEALARTAVMRPPSALDDPLLLDLQQASVVSAQYGKVARANVLFALGRSYERLQQYDLAFDAFAKGNRFLLRQSGRVYDPVRAQALTDALIRAFAAGVPAHHDSTTMQSQPTTATPLFICGMFRSGSTLVEQVLAAHPQVTAGGELDFLMRVAAERFAPFPASMVTPDATRDAGLANEYLEHLRRLFPQQEAGTYITDKRPDNYLLIGLIKRMFPAAKIIHTTRHPLDVGVSVFTQHLNLKVTGYASDLADIGHHYGEYRRLMAHWQSLYADDIFDFRYDELVSEPRPALARLFGFLDIEWDERCLDFHQVNNTVKTASYWQVRQPLYGSASGRWRNYQRHLGPLRTALAAAGLSAEELS